MAEQKPHTLLLNKLLSLKEELKDYRKTIKSIKQTNPDDIRDLLVAHRELTREVEKIKDELLVIEIDIGTNTRAFLDEVPPGYVSNKGLSRENASNSLKRLGYGGRKTRRNRKR